MASSSHVFLALLGTWEPNPDNPNQSVTFFLEKQNNDMNERSNNPPLDTVLNYEDNAALIAALEASISDWNVFFNDTDVSEKDVLHNELKRLQAVKSSGILISNQKIHLERFTTLVSRIFDVPMCLVSIVDLGRIWLVSNRGFGDIRETQRTSSTICSHAIQSLQDVFVVPDTIKDSRFKNNCLVTGAPHVRFYASSPLTTHDGYKLGNLCIIDVKPRSDGLSFSEKETLVDMTTLVMDHIDSMRRFKDEKEKFKAETVATTAHDLITPLSAIQLNIGLICDDHTLMDKIGEQYQNILYQTKECVDLLSSICQQAIQSYHEKCSKSSLELSHEDKAGIVNTSNFLSTLRHIMETYPKRVPLTIRCEDDVPSFIKSDIVSLFRASINLLTNACKVTESGFIDFSLHLELSTSAKEGFPMLLFKCIDTGPGINEKDTSHLFSADGGMMLSQKSEKGGSGLGLNSVRELITRVGGRFGYTPRDGNGTGSIFWFCVPTCEDENHETMIQYQGTAITKPEVSEDITGNSLGTTNEIIPEENKSGTALILCDSRSIRKFLLKGLQMHGYRVMEAENFSQGLQEMKADQFDLVFCDFLMPESHGLQYIQQYREWEQLHRKSQTLIIGISTECNDYNRHRGTSSGINEFISIPFSIRTLHDFLMKNENTRLNTSICSGCFNPPTHIVAKNVDQPICLLVEDSASIAKAMVNCIKRQNWQVFLVQDGKSALEILKSRTWDAIFMDDQLPYLSGSSCVAKFRDWEEENHMPRQKNLFLCSADLHHDDVLPVQGFDGYMYKPVQMPKLISILNKCALDRDVISK